MSPPRSPGDRPPRWRRWAGFLVIAGLVLGFLNIMSPAPALGPVGGRLQPCPASPNCVCSDAETAPHAIAPLPCPGPATATAELSRLRALVLARARTRLVEEGDGYLRFEVTTALFRFRDDLEFLADDAGQIIHVRSASRVGHSDLGTNRRRLEEIRSHFAAANH